MKERYEGNAIVFCDGAFGTTNGKTAHGLVRRSERYRVVSVVDAACAGSDAGDLLDGKENGIPVFATVADAIEQADTAGLPATHLVIGLAPDGGRLPGHAREILYFAAAKGLSIVSGLHDFLGDDRKLVRLAAENGVQLIDIRRPPGRQDLHFFSGKIEEVEAGRIAVLGTDSAVGKRTTAWLLVDALRRAGISAELVGTGQTAWLQGARYSVVFDALVNDFVSGEIEHAVWSAWKEASPEVIVIEGQGSLMNPAYPGGFEILAAGRPHCVIMQHAPGRIEYDGFPGYPIHPLRKQIQAVELLSGRPVVAITANSEGLTKDEVKTACLQIKSETGLMSLDPLVDGVGPLIDAVLPWIAGTRSGNRPAETD